MSFNFFFVKWTRETKKVEEKEELENAKRQAKPRNIDRQAVKLLIPDETQDPVVASFKTRRELTELVNEMSEPHNDF